MDFLIGEGYASIVEARAMKPSQLVFWARRMSARNERLKREEQQ